MSPTLTHLWNHRVVLYRLETTRDEFNDVIEGWVAQTSPSGKNALVDQTWLGDQMDRGPGEQQAGHRIWSLDKRFADVRERDVLLVTTGPEAGAKVRILSVTRPTIPPSVEPHHFEVNTEVYQGELTSPTPVVTTVTLSPATFEVEVDEDVLLTVVVRDQFGVIMTGWVGTVESSNEAIATATIDGDTVTVSGVGAGDVTITVTVSGVSGESEGTVPAPPVATVVTVTPDPFTVDDGDTVELTVEVRDQYDEVMVGWTGSVESSDEGIATATIDGVTVTVTGESAGLVTITVTVDGVEGEADGEVLVAEIFLHTYTGANGTNLHGLAADTGQVGVSLGGSWEIQNNRARFGGGSTDNNRYLVWEIGVADLVWSSELPAIIGTAYLPFRVTDINNLHILTASAPLSNHEAYKREAGAFTQTAGVAGAPTTGEKLAARCAASSIAMEVDDIEIASWVSSFNALATTHGIGQYQLDASEFDNTRGVTL